MMNVVSTDLKDHSCSVAMIMRNNVYFLIIKERHLDQREKKPSIGLLVKPRGNFVLQKRFSTEGVVDKTAEEVAHHEHYLQKAGYRVRRVEWGPSVVGDLANRDFDLAFNVSSLAEAAILEELGVPYVGSDPFAIGVATEKSLAKRLWLRAGLPTAPFAVVKSQAECEAFLKSPGIPFPLFLKPVAGRGSAGISPSSLVDSAGALRDGVAERLSTIGQPVLIESYLRGREITVGVLGSSAPKALPPLEIVLKEGDVTLTFEKKERDDDDFLCPAPLSEKQTRRLQKVAVDAFQTLGMRDYGRLDLMLTETGPYLLEANTFAGLMCTPLERPHSYVGFMAKAAGIAPEDLLDRLVQSAWSRVGK